MLLSTPDSPAVLLTQAELLRRADLSHFSKHFLPPDFRTSGGRVKLFKVERVAELRAAIASRNAHKMEAAK